MTFDSSDGNPDPGDFNELPGAAAPQCTARELVWRGFGDLLATGILVLVALVTAETGWTTSGIAGGLLLAFSGYLGLLVLWGTFSGMRNLIAARRLRDTGLVHKVAPSGWSQHLEELVTAAAQNPDSLLAQARAAQEAWLERDFERARIYAQRADKLRPDFQRMLLILMSVHWHQGEGKRAQQYAERLVGMPSRLSAHRMINTVLTWPLLLLPSIREGRRRSIADQQADEAWEKWARWLVDKYEVRVEDENDSDA